MAYTPPTGSGINFAFGDPYTAPTGSGVNFDISAGGGERYISAVTLGDFLSIGSPSFKWPQYAYPDGIFDGSDPSVEIVYPGFTIDFNFSTTYDVGTGLPIEYAPPGGAAADFEFYAGTSQYVLPDTIYAPAFDSVHAFTGGALPSSQSIYPSGIDGVEFGVATATLLLQHISPTGASWASFGTASVYNSTQYVSCSGADWSAFGTTVIRNRNQTISASGEDWARVGAGTELTLGLAPLYGEGFDSVEFGEHEISFYTREVFHDGDDLAEFGVAEVTNFDLQLDATGSDFAEFGTAWAANGNIFPDDMDTMLFGTASISNLLRRITPSGINAAEFPTYYPVVSNYTRYLYTNSSNNIGGFIGTGQWVSNYTRTVTTRGADSLKFGLPLVGNKNQYARPKGFDLSVVWDYYGPIDPITGLPARVYNAYGSVTTSGHDSAAFGEPSLTPVTARLYPWRLDGAVVPSPFITGVAVIRPSSIDSLEFGELQEWEAGKIKVQATDYLSFGGHEVQRGALSLLASGADHASFGTARTRQVIGGSGFDAVELGDPVAVMEWGCRYWVMAGVTVGSQSQFGTHAVS